MPVKVKDQGRYELFETDHGHRILVLNDDRWFAWIHGQESPILVHSDADHVKAHTLQRGKFYFVDFEEDPRFKDMPHLFLQDGEEYDEFLLPNGFPTEQDAQKRFVVTDETLSARDLERYLEHPAPAGPGEWRMERPGGGSMANVAHYLGGIALPADRSEILSHARDRGAPDEVMEQLRRIDLRSYGDMAEVMSAIGGAPEREAPGDRELPIPNYDELNVREATGKLAGLDRGELERLRRYEAEHKERKTMLEAIERRLEREG